MKIIKPSYYDKFSCIAGACNFTCCQEWDIAVDPATRERWEKLGIRTRKYLRDGLSGECIKLGKNGLCPFLREDRLCSLVVRYGEKILSQTCHTFPREKHVFGDRTEQTLAMGCPEALRLLWQEDYFETEESKLLTPESKKIRSAGSESSQSENVLSESAVSDTAEPEAVFSDSTNYTTAVSGLSTTQPSAPDLICFRDKLCQLVQNKEFSIEEALRIAFFIALDIDEKWNKADDENIDDDENTDNQMDVWNTNRNDADENFENSDSEESSEGGVTTSYVSRQFQIDNLRQMKAVMDGVQRDEYDHICEQNELLLDLSVNYRKRGLYSDILEPLARKAEEYEEEELLEEFARKRKEFEKIWTSPDLDRKLRLLFAEEIYSNIYMPEGDTYTVLLKLEWLAIFYASLKQSLFLTCELKKSSRKVTNNTEKSLEQIIVMLVRMTGYSDADIEEYLENSFESPIWEWGYLALIV